jgi:hypothetical protein
MKSELYGGFINLLLRSPGRDGVLEAVGACWASSNELRRASGMLYISSHVLCFAA